MEKRSLFQFSIENALEIVIVFDKKGTIVYANKKADRSLEYDEGLLGVSIVEIFPGNFQFDKGSLLIEGGLGGELSDMIAYRKNRTCFPAKVKLLLYEDIAEQMYICTAYDVSTTTFLEKRVSQIGQEVEEAQKVKSEFVANVTHELRTPVNGILGNTLELLGQETEKDKLKLLQLIERGCKDMHALINSILDFSKLEAGKFTLEQQKFNFHNMIDYVKGNHSNRIIEKGLEFIVTISPEIPEYIIGDELRIVQILNNLISNAYKFTEQGEIHLEAVKTAQTDNRIELFFMVIDTGIGIAKADQDKLFKSFSQVDASISRKYGGTGLGLNICKQLVELMGGHIHVESDVGKGTLFAFHIWVELPEEECGTDNFKEDIQRSEEFDLLHKLQSLTENCVSEKIWKYGEEENKEELGKKLSKLTLSIEMDNWEKAEMFSETVKKLLEEAPREVKSAGLRLKMAVQKGDYDKAMKAIEALQEML